MIKKLKSWLKYKKIKNKIIYFTNLNLILKF